ncbi:hypothetical protein TeGR_g8502 [Tetraparma gracilis]|uniref:Uncharacterized protein n=1 Tax=Tetraparma gracilis TaxID=2962635 RepID=A0ABQ6MUA1_9STRA|nr:hypothetical protein TeGR_g8502 [Tetraparma gracilis]
MSTLPYAGHRPALLSPGDPATCLRSRNLAGNHVPCTIVSRRCMRGLTNRDEPTLCEFLLCVSCGLCCRERAARSIDEAYLYKVRFADGGVEDGVLEEDLRRVAAATAAPEAPLAAAAGPRYAPGERLRLRRYALAGRRSVKVRHVPCVVARVEAAAASFMYHVEIEGGGREKVREEDLAREAAVAVSEVLVVGHVVDE